MGGRNLPASLRGITMRMMTVATEIQSLSDALNADILAWGAAAIGLAIAAAAVAWVKSILA